MKMDAKTPGEYSASVWTGQGAGTMASTGNLNITRYDSAGIEGTYDLSFPDGSDLHGGFNLTFGANCTFTVQGTWMGTAVAAVAPVPTYSDGVNTSTFLNVGFFDDQLEAKIWLHVPGYLAVGDNNALSLGIEWRPVGGPQINASSDQAGNLHITSLTAPQRCGQF